MDVVVEAIDVRDEQDDENLRDFLMIGERGAVFVMKLTWSWRALRWGALIFLTETTLVSWKFGLLASLGRFIHSSSILKVKKIIKNYKNVRKLSKLTYLEDSKSLGTHHLPQLSSSSQ